LNFEISARRAKSGNLVLETLDKDQADSLVVVLKRRFGDSSGIRRPTPSTALILIGIEDSIDEEELKKTLETHVPELKTLNVVKIREGSNGVRTAIVRVPISPGLKLARLKKLKMGWSICRNSHSAEWGSLTEDVRGSLLSDFTSTLDLTTCNVGTVPTFRRVNATSVIDVTFARSTDNRSLVHDWSVLEQRYSGSDYEYIAYSVFKHEPRRRPMEVARLGGWSVKQLSPAAMKEHWDHVGAPHALPRNASMEEHVEHLQEYLTQACDAAMPARSMVRGKRAVYWWSEEIAELRKTAIAARRSYQRARRRSNTEGR